MRYILPILTSALLLAALESLAWGQPANADDRGNRIVAASVQSLLSQPSLEAKVRQRAKLFGQYVNGAGIYLQMRDEDRTLIRYEFKLQVSNQNQSNSFVHVNDGTTLWLRSDNGGSQSQAYVNVRRLRDAQKRMAGVPTYSQNNAVGELALGGISQVLAGLAENFQFSPPRESEMSGVPLWEIDGIWKAERLAAMLPDQQAAIAAGQSIDASKLPSHIPDTVKLLLGRDQTFRLFPYRIELGRTSPRREGIGIAQGTTGEPTITPLVTMELFEVRRRPDLTPSDFGFHPSDENVEDRTDMYLKKLGLVRSGK